MTNTAGRIWPFTTEPSKNLNALNDSTNLDTILQEQMKRHGENPWFLMAAAELYQTASHTFKLADGKYIRVNRSWEGEYSGQKRTRWSPALPFEGNEHRGTEQGHETARPRTVHDGEAFLKNYDDYRSSPHSRLIAALANLTGLDKLPGYVSNQEASNYATFPAARCRDRLRKTGNRFHHASSSWDTAGNDGERVCWLLDAAVRANPELANEVNLFTASWCRNLLSYANTEPYQEFVYGPGNAGSVEGINPADLKTDQTVVRTDRTDKGNSCSSRCLRITTSSGLHPG